jgi:hydrogenase expression/formation protein HypD
MKYIDEYRDGAVAQKIAQTIAREAQPGRRYHFMEFCGGHTHAISRYGIADLLPKNVKMIHGPGCPVCVLPIGRIDSAIELAQKYGVTLFTYADTMRVPASNRLSLIKAKAQGMDIHMLYSCADALAYAQSHPEKQVVFFAIGFETTTPPTAVILKQAKALQLKNFSVFCNHVLTPPAIAHILDTPEKDGVSIDGFIGPAHVSTVIGSNAYKRFTTDYHKPVVIAGFEPLDVMQAILMLVRQINDGRSEIENEFTRAVTPEGNLKAIALMREVFELRDSFEWRGLGEMPKSALKLNKDYREFDAEIRFDIPYRKVPDNKACECGLILRGIKEPKDCKAFGTACTPDNPLGSCMVSSEGACAAHYTYGRFRDERAAK